MTHPHITPQMIAAADQELAQVNEIIDALVVTYRLRQAECDATGITDPLERVAMFMIQDVFGQLSPATWCAALAVAVERLAREQQ